MRWNAYPLGSKWSPGAKVEVTRILQDEEISARRANARPAINDHIDIEFPDRSPSGGIVVNSSAREIVIKKDSAEWRLVLSTKSSLVEQERLSLVYIIKERLI